MEAEVHDYHETVRRIAEEHPYVEVAATEFPPLTNNSLIDAVNQTGFGVNEIDQLGRAESPPMDRSSISHYIAKIALAIGGGLDRQGKRMWIEVKLDQGKSVREILKEAEDLKDSPFS